MLTALFGGFSNGTIERGRFILLSILLIVTRQMANMTFFLIVLMTASDVIAGFTVTLSTARRDMQHP